VEITGEIEVIYKMEKLHWGIATLCPGLGKPCRLTNYYIQFAKLDGYVSLQNWFYMTWKRRRNMCCNIQQEITLGRVPRHKRNKINTSWETN
jgi:hypothetical protein